MQICGVSGSLLGAIQHFQIQKNSALTSLSCGAMAMLDKVTTEVSKLHV